MVKRWTFEGEFVLKAKKIGTVGKEKVGSIGVHRGCAYRDKWRNIAQEPYRSRG